MISTKYYMRFIILSLIYYCCIVTADSDNTLELRGEPIHKKLLSSNNLKLHDVTKSDESTNKIVLEPQPAASIVTNTNTAITNDDNNDKTINKRQQFSQAKPVRQLPNRKTETPNKRVDSCPLCDSSVFSYCSDKLLHDACCCLNPFENNLPYQCQYADCNFLHANSCREHHLITSCCCDRYLLKV